MFQVTNDQYYIGLFGPKNSGKTVYLTAVYCFNDQAGVLVSAPDSSDNPTHSYLEGAYRRLLERKWPDANPTETPKELRFELTSNGILRKLVLPDIAGELIRRTSFSDGGDSIESSSAAHQDQFEGYRDQLKEGLMNAYELFDAFIIFAPCDAEDSETLDHMWEVSALLEVIKKRSSKSAKIKRPIAVVASKWDIVSDETDSSDATEQQALDYFKNRFSETYHALDATCENFRIFPVSSTGACDGLRPPRELKPFGVTAVLSWLLETADQSALKRADEYFHEHATHLFTERDGTLYFSNARHRYDAILDKSHDPAIRTASNEKLAELSSLQKTHIAKKAKRRVWLGIASVCAILFIGAVTWGAIDYSTSNELTRRLDAAEFTYDEMIPAIDNAKLYCASALHPIGSQMGLTKSLRSKLDQRHADWEDHEFHKLHASWKEISDSNGEDTQTSRLNAFVENAASYTAQFEMFERANSIHDLHVQAQDRLTGLDNRRRFARLSDQMVEVESLDSDQLGGLRKTIDSFFLEVTGLTQEDLKTLTQFDNRIAVLKANLDYEAEYLEFKAKFDLNADSPIQQFSDAKLWLDRNPKASPAVRQLVEESRARADNATWQSIQSYSRVQSSNYAGQLEKVNSYLNNSDFSLHTDVAKVSRDSQLRNWDQQLYNELKRKSESATTRGELIAVGKRCDDYLEFATDRRPGTMKTEVEHWLKWFGNIQNGLELPVKLKAVTVEKQSIWHGWLYYPTVYVSVKVGDKKDSSGKKNLSLGVRTVGFPESELGPFTARIANDVVVEVSITCTDFREVTLPPRIMTDSYACRLLNQTIEFDNGKIKVELECPDVLPPSLPVYKKVQ